MRVAAIVVGCLIGSVFPALAEPSCPGNPDALGTSRTITVDPAAFPRIGSIQYKRTLPLADHEVVITFDDGPLPPYTNRVLDTLAAHCVKVTYFLVGQMARAYPDLVRRIYNDGHVIGTHSQNHPLTFDQMAEPRIAREVQTGIASVTTALGDPRAMAPFFRIPGLARSRQVESYLASQSLAVWSADEVADDWHRGITARDIVRLAIKRIEAKGHRGVLLLHDIHPATALALPTLLKELKSRGYRIVQAVPAGERPATVPEPVTPAVIAHAGWPRVIKASVSGSDRPVKAVKVMHRRKRVADRDPEVTASIAKRKRKPVTASVDNGFLWFPQ
jgi:peptidoglycan/xylan/chitin deacetylase (PgdA/CDA1 family)